MLTVLTEVSKTEVDSAAGNDLWMTAADAEKATGWQLKPEGFCKGDICVPVPKGRENDFVAADRVNISALWTLMGNPAVHNDKGDVWFLGTGAGARNDAMLSLEAPDFELPDFTGKLHRLTDFRRKRILLITWASW